MEKRDLLPGVVLYLDAFPDADQIFLEAQKTLDLTQQYIDPFHNGASIPMPRLSAWYGDPGARYSYSGLDNAPLPWVPVLSNLRDRLNKKLKLQLNSCLANLYRDGTDSISWHSDNERGLTGTIVSVSFGVARQFQMRLRNGAMALYQDLPHGSVLTMTVESNFVYQHRVPKEPKKTGTRLNLTFRTIQHD